MFIKKKGKSYFGKNLIDSIKADEDEVLKEFYIAHQQNFTRWAKKKFNFDTNEALDFYHDAISILVLNIKQERLVDPNNDSLMSYVYRTAQNIILNSIEKKNVQLRHTDTFEEHYIFLKEEDHGDERVSFMKKAIKSLEEPCHSILKLFYYDALPVKKIAEELGYKNDSVVRNQKKRCMNYLKDSYTKLIKEEKA